jgi:hypothetical protein
MTGERDLRRTHSILAPDDNGLLDVTRWCCRERGTGSRRN